MNTKALLFALAFAAGCVLAESPSVFAKAAQLATITVVAPDAVKVLPLSAGQIRLSNSKWTFKKVRADLKGAQFTSIPPRFASEYQIHVETPGVIYAFAVKKKKTLEQYIGESDPRWISDDSAVEGSNPLACYLRAVSPGETIVLHGFELQLTAAHITLAGASTATPNSTTASPASVAAGNAAHPPSQQIQPFLESSLDAVLAPLQDDPSMPRVGVETLGAKLGAGVVRARTPSQKQIYECAVAVCQALTAGMDARAQARADAIASGLLPSVSNGGSIVISSGRGSGRGAGGAGEAIRQKQKDERNDADSRAQALSNFMESSAYKAWVARAKGLRDDAMSQYAKLVQLEAVDPSFDTSPSVAPPPTPQTSDSAIAPPPAAATASLPKTDATPALVSPSTPASVPKAETAEFPGVVWKNRLAEDSLWKDGGWQHDGSTLGVVRNRAFTAFPETFTDAAIRVRFRFDGPGGSFIDLITRSDGKSNGDRYVATTLIGNKYRMTMELRVKNGGDRGSLGVAGPMATLKPGDEHTLALYVQGDHLAYYVDGQPVSSFQDSSRAQGKLGLFTGNQVHFLSVETADLSKGPVAANAPVADAGPASPGIPATPAPIVAPAATTAPPPRTDSAPALASLSTKTPVPKAANDGFVNTLGMKFVPVPGVKVLFSIWDTRVQDYAAYARGKALDNSWTKQQKGGVPVGLGSSDPVVGVSWNDAHAFCRWLTETERAKGTLPNDSAYRLPTDEEWSRAVGLEAEKGDTPAEKSRTNHTDFPWGTQFPPPKANLGNYGDAAKHEKFPHEGWIESYSDGFAAIAPVGSFPPNRFGLYDMGGNVWQWCEDWFDGIQKDRVLRGASWTCNRKDDLLSAARHSSTPTYRGCTTGFRCVLKLQK